MLSISPSSWNSLVACFPEPHFLQSWEWAQVKEPLGWQAHFLSWSRNGEMQIYNVQPGELRSLSESEERRYGAVCLLLERRISIAGFSAGFSVMYAPKGPLLVDWNDASLRSRVLRDMCDYARMQGAVFIKLDPDIQLPAAERGNIDNQSNQVGHKIQAELADLGGHYSDEQVQFRSTLLIDLTPSEEELLSAMKQKTRYNIRLAERKGVEIRKASEGDLGVLYRMYAETSVRDGFVIRDQEYYLRTWSLFMHNSTADQPKATAFLAEVEGESVAGLVIFSFRNRAWYVYGMSLISHRDKMPNYLLQWYAIKDAKRAGCIHYDLWGAPEVLNETDSMWGVYRFKEGLGGVLVRHIGAWDIVLRPFWYRIYNRTLPRILAVLRSRGREHTRRGIMG